MIHRETLMNEVTSNNQLSSSHRQLRADPWIAASTLQKAIRRGHLHWSIMAAKALAEVDPRRVVRRLPIIAVEDVGVANSNALCEAISMSRYLRQWVADLGQGVAGISARLASSAKCRAADDLFVVTEYVPCWRDARVELAHAPLCHLLDVIGSDDCIVRSAIAARYLLGTPKSSSISLTKRRGRPAALFDHYRDLGVSHVVVEAARDGFVMTGEHLFGLWPLLALHFDGSEAEIVSDDMPTETLCGGVPGWAIDYFTRRGRRALSRFIKIECETTRWLRDQVPAGQRVEFIGGVLFRVESGLVKDRLRWPLADELRRQADVLSHPGCEDATEIIRLLRGDVDLLNGVRADVV